MTERRRKHRKAMQSFNWRTENYYRSWWLKNKEQTEFSSLFCEQGIQRGWDIGAISWRVVCPCKLQLEALIHFERLSNQISTFQFLAYWLGKGTIWNITDSHKTVLYCVLAKISYLFCWNKDLISTMEHLPSFSAKIQAWRRHLRKLVRTKLPWIWV